ncbi:hypothetical protein BD560DRAFT_329950 [Blakeslea trispora]|nr:hypothetical protein BD560DRAFT_329950 [Blakeslea trispora]
MTYSESVFNVSLLFPCLAATTTFLQHNSDCDPCFTPGEEQLNAMTQQLIITGLKVDNREKYNADGIIRLRELYDLEILLLETSGCFQNKDERKISFDNAKGMLALLAMMKTVADKFSYASVALFQKLKLYFIQASDEHIRLWSIQYVSNGIYSFNREDKVTIIEDESQVQQVLIPLLDFFYHVKTSLAETSDVLHQLKLQDEENRSSTKDNSSQKTLLSDLICPNVFRLTYNRHGKGFGRQPLISSLESDY